MTGIDVSAAQGEIDWARVKAAGMDFAMIRATCGRSGTAETDPRFPENLAGAAEAGIGVGVYHALDARDLAAALTEADGFLSRIAPYRERIPLWACGTAEKEALPREPGRAADVIGGFLRKVQAAGFSPMLGITPMLLTRLGGHMPYPLWLLYWNASEARAMGFSPKIWQYDAGRVDGIGGRVPVNRGYFRMPRT